MSKAVELNGDTLEVKTSFLDDSPNIRKVVLTRKGQKEQVFYKQPREINEPESLNEIILGGYRAIDLIIVAERLKGRDVNGFTLANYTDGFKDGYKKAYAEQKEALERVVNDYMSGFDDLAELKNFTIAGKKGYN